MSRARFVVATVGGADASVCASVALPPQINIPHISAHRVIGDMGETRATLERGEICRIVHLRQGASQAGVDLENDRYYTEPIPCR